MASWLLQETKEKRVTREALLLDTPSDLAALAHPLAWRIVQEVAKSPDYVSRLARRLKVHEQTVYYHVNRLRKAGVLRVASTERVKGSQSASLVPCAEAFAVALAGRGTTSMAPSAPEELRRFFADFSRDGALDAWIVMGAPTPHGPFLTAARDGPYAVQLGLTLGSFLAPRGGMQMLLDTDARGARMRENLIVIGGPVANIVTQELNPHLPVRFDWQQSWRLRSGDRGPSYVEEEVGLVAKIRNPADPDRWVLVLAGVHTAGTVAAILAVTERSRDLLRGHQGGAFTAVVRGLDRDGDGRIDDVAVIESRNE